MRFNVKLNNGSVVVINASSLDGAVRVAKMYPDFNGDVSNISQAQDMTPDGVLAALSAAGVKPLDVMEWTGGPSIDVVAADQVFIDRRPVGKSWQRAAVVITPAGFDIWGAGTHDSIRDGSGSRMVSHPTKFVFLIPDGFVI